MSHATATTSATDARDLAPGPDDGRTVFRPIRLGVALFLGGMLWIGPFIAMNAVLLPARLEQIAPDQKVALIAVLATAGSIVAMLANIVFGATSDLTRSRFGRRAPWMVFGSLGSAASLCVLMTTEAVPMLVVCWMAFQLFLNILASPMVATLADRVPLARRGTFSAIYGTGFMIGIYGSQILASRFVENPTTGMLVFAVLVLLAGPVVAFIAPEKSNRAVPRESFSLGMLAHNFAFPRKNSRDYYLALSAKLLFILGQYTLSGYQLYILTDYMGQSMAEAGDLIATMATIGLVTSLVCGAISGPLSDKIGRRKGLVIFSAMLVAGSSLVPFFFAQPWAMLTYALISGIGAGLYNSVDQALNTEVLPDPDTAAKDMGILNMANTGGQIMGPGVTSAVVGVTGSYGPVFVVATAAVGVSALLIKPIKSVK